MKAMLESKNLADLVTEMLYQSMDGDKYKDENGHSVDMSDTEQVFLDRFGGIIPANSSMTFREYVDSVNEREGVLRPYKEEY